MARRKASSRRRSTSLHALADRLGIIGEYVDQTGRERRHTSDRTRAALLAAMGFEVGNDAAAADALAALRELERERILPPAHVTTDGAAPIALSLPRGWPARVEWTLEIENERGETSRTEGRAASGK